MKRRGWRTVGVSLRPLLCHTGWPLPHKVRQGPQAWPHRAVEFSTPGLVGAWRCLLSEWVYEPVPTLPSSCNCPSQLRLGRGTQPGLDFQGVCAHSGTTQRCIISLDLTECLRARMWAVNRSMYNTEGHGPDMETAGGPLSPRRRCDSQCVRVGYRGGWGAGDSPLWLQNASWQRLAWAPAHRVLLGPPTSWLAMPGDLQHAEDTHSLK